MTSLGEARAKGRAFQRGVERFMKRLPTRHYLPFAAQLLRDSLAGRAGVSPPCPPFWILHSIEASCAFAREYRTAPVTQQFLGQLFEHYRSFVDPYQMYLLGSGRSDELDLFFVCLARQQFPVQRTYNKADFARASAIFLGDRLAGLKSQFQSELGFDFESWMVAALAMWSAATRRERVVVSIESFAPGIRERDPMVAVALNHLSRDVSEVGAEYRALRATYPEHLESMLQNGILTRPLIRMRSGEYLLPSEHLLARAAVDGLLHLACEHAPSEFAAEFGGVFEGYIGEVLGHAPGLVRLYSERDLERLVDGRVCDYLLITESAVLLIESKVAVFRTELVTADALARSGARSKVSEAFEQLGNVAIALRDHPLAFGLERLGDLAVYGVVVTADDLIFPNSDFFYSKVRSGMRWGGEMSGFDSLFSYRPQVLDIRSLEVLMALARSAGSLHAVIDSKLQQAPAVVGEWSTFLNKEALRVDPSALPGTQERFDELFDHVLARLESWR